MDFAQREKSPTSVNFLRKTVNLFRKRHIAFWDSGTVGTVTFHAMIYPKILFISIYIDIKFYF